MDILDFQSESIRYRETVFAQAEDKGATHLGQSTVADLASHLVMVNVMCARSLDGHGPETLPSAESLIGNDVRNALKETTNVFLSSFSQAADLQKICPTPVGLFPAWVVQTQGSLEHLIHACDIAVALQIDGPSDALVADATTRILSNTTLFDTFRSMDMYKAPTEVSPNATALKRLLAYLGR